MSFRSLFPTISKLFSQQSRQTLKSSCQKAVKPLVFSSVGLLLAGGVTWVAGDQLVKRQSAEMDAQAAEFFQQYPPVESNASARSLNRLFEPLGIAAVDNGPKGEALGIQSSESYSSELSRAIRHYFRDQRLKAEGSIDPLPVAIQSHLADHAEALKQVEMHLRSQPAPVWSFNSDWFTDFDQASSTTIGIRDIHRLLLFKALSDHQKGQLQDMTAALEAAQVLANAPAKRPDLISYLVSLLMLDNSVAVMRHLDGLSPEITAQLLTYDQQQLSLDRLHFENWAFQQALSKGLSKPNSVEPMFGTAARGLATIPMLVFERPYVLLSTINSARVQTAIYQQLPGQTICSFPPEDIHNTVTEALPWWNILGKMSAPSFVEQWRKGGDRMLTAELNHLVTQAKALASKQGTWPETLPDLTSNACPNERWVYEVSPAGEMSLSFSREFDWRVNDDLNPARYIPLTYSANLSNSAGF